MLAVPVFCLSMQCCKKYHADLPNGYRLQDTGNSIRLRDPHGVNLLNCPVTEVRVYKEHVYGWYNTPKLSFYYLNTLTGNIRIFKKWSDLDKFTDQIGLPRFHMNDAYTYWDLTSGYKKPTW